MNIVEKIKHDISGVEDALQNAKSRRDVLCSVLHQEANQLNLTLRRAIRNAVRNFNLFTLLLHLLRKS